MDVIDLTQCSDSEVLEISSDDDDEQDQFKKDLELAKRLSLSEYQKVTPKQFNLTSLKEKIRSGFKRIKFNWKLHDVESENDGSISVSEASESEYEGRIGTPKKYRKLEDGRRQTQDNYFSDDLPDLEIVSEPVGVNNTSELISINNESLSEQEETTQQQEEEGLNAGGDVISVQVIEEWKEEQDEDFNEDLVGVEKETIKSPVSREVEEEQIKSPVSREVEEEQIKSPVSRKVEEEQIKSPMCKDVKESQKQKQIELPPSKDVKETQQSPQLSSPEVLLSEKAKSNLASILKKVKSNEGSIFKSLKLSSVSESQLAEVTDVSCEESVQDVEAAHQPIEAVPSTSSSEDWRIQPPKVPINQNKKPRRCKIHKASLQEEQSLKRSGDIRGYMSPVKKSVSLEKQRICEFLKPLRINFEENSMENLRFDMESLQINTVQACFDEEDPDCLRRGLQFVEDFLYTHKPQASIVKHVLEHGLLKSRDLSIMLKSYNILVRINQKYLGLIKMDWDMLKDVMQELNIGRGLFLQEPILLTLGSHFLQLFNLVLETDLYQRDLTQTIRQSLAYKLLSYDCAYLNLKELINWTVCAITCGEYMELLDERYIQRQQDNSLSVRRADIPKILPLLNKLIALSIKVSSSCSESAQIIAKELLTSYKYLPSLQHKRLLIESMKSDVLRYRFVILVLERNSEDYVPSCEFPIDLKVILESLFTVLPPRFCLTPPTTPQSDDEEGPAQLLQGQYPTAEIEEFVMLLYYVLQSHLHCTRRRSHRSLRSQAYCKPKDVCRLQPDDERELESIPSHVEELRSRLLRLTPELTSQTETYLAKMACLSFV